MSLRLAVPLALCACAGSMTRAPKQIPANGVVECTDSMETPIAATIGAVVGVGGLTYAMTQLDDLVGNGGVLWAPLLGVLSLELLYAAAAGHSYATECRAAKRRGAEQAELARGKEAHAKSRAEAGTLWKRAALAARADDCATVRELDPQVRELDAEFHAVVFARDVAIARCLIPAVSR